ncbi:MAG TPA: FAD-linked oxidase C-terminal domain-containing protein, partial [Nitriliruptoraceae bacterium]|nr:FAD-linked oxidase C-terminal domain-containing protein [Nitriliruptoraceae bacterium]
MVQEVELADVAQVDLVAALRAAGLDDVDDSVLARAMHAQDASLHRVVPRVVVAPRDADDVAAIVAVSRATGVPVTARGAGTSIAGNAIGPGIVVEFRRHMDRILHLGPDRAIVQPGVVLDDLQRAAAVNVVRVGAEPATHSRATLGGMVGNNSCGARALGHGRTSDGVAALAMVTGAGEAVTLGDDRDLAGVAGSDAVARARLVDGLAAIGAEHAATIRSEFARVPRQVSGYALEHLLANRDGGLAPRSSALVAVGSEGTLGLTTAIEVDLVAVPAHTVLVVLGHPDLATAADAVPGLLAHRPVAIEGLDARIVDAVRARRADVDVPPLPAGNGWLFVELGGDDPGQLAAAAAALVAEAEASDAVVVTDARHARALWAIREAGAGLAAVAPSGRPGHAGWEDSAVAPERLGDYLRDLEVLMVEHGLTGMPYGHFGDGCLHVRLDFALRSSDGPARYRRFMEAATELVISHGGTTSGEHGDGRMRSWLLDRLHGEEGMTAMRRVKTLFDPDGICNPGIIVDPVPGDRDLRAVGVEPVAATGFAMTTDSGDLTTATHRCTGVGACVATTPATQVMCPSWRATQREQDSTRGRARVLQEVLRGDLVADVDDPAVDAALDLCLSCKACASDCPTGVDMARLKSEVLHRRRRGSTSLVPDLLGNLPSVADLAARVPGLANRSLSAPGVSRVLKRVADVDPRRSLPTFAATTFQASYARMAAAGRLPQAPSPVGPVVLWVDTFTDHFAP